jgi:hypothetical protein
MTELNVLPKPGELAEMVSEHFHAGLARFGDALSGIAN